MRFRKEREQTLAMFLDRDLRADFLGRLRTFAELRSVVLTDVVGALEELARLPITTDKRDRLAAFLLYGCRREDYKRPTYYRRVAELRGLGIAVDPVARPGRVVVPIGDYLTRLSEPWARAA
jgi:hypothetical protein